MQDKNQQKNQQSKQYTNLRFGVIGGGSWGTAIAAHIARVRQHSLIYVRDIEVVSGINQYHLNKKYLNEVILPNGLEATSNLTKLVDNSDVIVIAVPSYAFTNTIIELQKSNLNKEQIILIATKGIAPDPVELFSDRISKILPNKFGFFSGPNFAKEVAEGKFAAITISSNDLIMAGNIANLLGANNCEIGITDDIITIQVASIVKNIIAVKSGMMNANEAGENAKAWLVTKAMQEISIITKALGSSGDALLEPAVIGDLVLTSYSSTSRNTKFGYEFHKANYSQDFLKNYPILVEGVVAARLIKQLLSNYNLALPVINSVVEILG